MQVDQISGADPNALRSKVEEWKAKAVVSFSGAGKSLGGHAAGMPHCVGIIK